ncbi:hypothetical protein J3D56_003284 [Erwinia persicina]|nr:hypothetical protein [Erwinia persicina]
MPSPCPDRPAEATTLQACCLVAVLRAGRVYPCQGIARWPGAGGLLMTEALFLSLHEFCLAMPYSRFFLPYKWTPL